MKIIIAGAYAIGTHLAQLLSRNNEDTVLIDSDEEIKPDMFSKMLQSGYKHDAKWNHSTRH